MKRILVLRFSSIGDIVLTTPVLRCIKEQWTEPVELHFLCKDAFREVVEFNPHIDRLWTYSNKPHELAGKLRQQQFDLVVDLQHNRRSVLLTRKLGAPFRRLNKLNLRKWIIVNLGIDLLPKRHVVERYMDTVRSFGISEDGRGCEYFLPESARGKHMLPDAFQSGYVLFALGGAHEGKRMSVPQWREIINQTRSPIVLVGGMADRNDADLILGSGMKKEVVDLCGKISLSESAALARDAQAVLSGDTGMMHIAACFRKKILSVWGCTVPEFGMYPYLPDPESVIMEPRELKKRPCSKLGNRCKYGMENRCIIHNQPAQIAETLNRWV